MFRNRQASIRVRGLLCLVAEGRGEGPRIGFAIARKHLPRAVHRNRLKRLLRERFRHERHALPALDLVVLSQREISSQPATGWPELCSQLFVRIIARSTSASST